MSKIIEITGNHLTIDELVSIARNDADVSVSKESWVRIKNSRSLVDDIISEGRTVYGINTGFGELANKKIDKDSLKELQENLILSHCTGVGPDMELEQVRAMMVVRINALAKGFSGVRPVVVETLVECLNKGLIPVVPSKGSVGASGDLVQSSHMVNSLCGRGECYFNGGKMSSLQAFSNLGLSPLILESKEGLALINGTHYMTAIGASACHDAKLIIKTAQIIGAMAMEALMATDSFLDPRVHQVRPHMGQIKIASNLLSLVEGSGIIGSHKDCPKVQDAYTLRCMPQILGSSADVLEHVWEKVEIEMNSATDNPLIFLDNNDIISQGNFHGQIMAFVLDYLCIGVSEVANWCERLIYRTLTSHLSGLPPFLTTEGGLNSGLMLLQYSSASLVAENKVLCHPSSCDSIPTSAGQEDHVSMGSTSAYKCSQVIENVFNVMSMGVIVAAQALEFREQERGFGTDAAYHEIRKQVPRLDRDRYMKTDIDVVHRSIRSGALTSAIEKIIEIPLL